MVSSSHGNTHPVKQRTQIIRVNPVYQERNHAAFLRCGTNDTQPGNSKKPSGGIVEQLLFVPGNGIESQRGDIAKGSSKCRRSYEIRRSCLEFEGQAVIGCLLERDALDHLTPAL